MPQLDCGAMFEVKTPEQVEYEVQETAPEEDFDSDTKVLEVGQHGHPLAKHTLENVRSLTKKKSRKSEE